MKNLDKIIKKYIDEGLYPGAQWKIRYHKKIYEGKSGFMNIHSKETIKENCLYRIWSMTKPIISIVILQLIEESKIKLDDPINNYLPDFGNLKVLKSSDSLITELIDIVKIPTIKNLLLHTAGFSYGFLGDSVGKEYDRLKLFYSSNTTLEEEIHTLSGIPLLYQPSSKWNYSVSIDILARIIEVVTKNSLQLELQKRIFSPLEMKDTSFNIHPDQRHLIMNSYEFNPHNNKIIDPIKSVQKVNNIGYPSDKLTYARGGHGLFSTINDYSKFAQMLLDGKDGKGNKIISELTLAKATKNHLDNHYFPLEIKNRLDNSNENDLEPYGWGFGFRVMINFNKTSSYNNIGEFGWSGAAGTFFLVDKKNDLTAILMTQVFGASTILQKNFIKEIYKDLS